MSRTGMLVLRLRLASACGETAAARSGGTARRRRNAACAAALIALACVAGPAQAQDLGNEVGGRDITFGAAEGLRTWDNIKMYGAERVEDRDRRAYKPDGLRIGNFLVFPTAGVSAQYDDNIYGAPRNAVSDIITQYEAGARILTNLPRHSFDFAFGGRFTHYAEHDNLDRLDGSVSLNGTINVNHAHTIGFSLSSLYGHLSSFAAPELITAASEPVPFWRNRAAVSFKRDAGRLWASVGVTGESTTFYNVRSHDGRIIDMSGRNLDVLSASLQAGYRFSPGYELQAKLRGLRQETPGNGLEDVDAWGYDAAIGLSAEISPLLRWQVFGGWAAREYDRGWAPANRAIGMGRITWLPTQLMTLTLTARRDIGDTPSATGSSGYVDDSLTLRLEYEALRNLVFTLQGQYRNLEFTGIDRRDHVYVGHIGLEYLHSKNTVFTIGYEHQLRESSVEEGHLARNRFMVGAKLRF